MATYGRQDPGEPYHRVSIQEAAEMHRQEVMVVDVRTQDEWVSGHIQGAVHIPVDNILAEAEEKLPRDQDLLFICAAGVRSGLACEMVSALGFDDQRLYNIEDGTPAWIDEDLHTEYGP